MSIPLQFDKVIALTTDRQLLQRRLDISFDKLTDFSKTYNTGVTDGSNAITGQIGEYKTNFRSIGNLLALTSGIASDIISISVTAGDWDVCGGVTFHPAPTTTISSFFIGISTVSMIFPTIDSGNTLYEEINYGAGTIVYNSLLTPICRLSLTTTTEIYLLGYSVFNISTMGVFGTIRARRVR